MRWVLSWYNFARSSILLQGFAGDRLPQNGQHTELAPRAVSNLIDLRWNRSAINKWGRDGRDATETISKSMWLLDFALIAWKWD